MRCKSLYITLLLLLVSMPLLRGQEMSTLFLRENPREEFYREIESDTILFYRPLAGGLSLYDDLAKFGFGFVSYSQRGADDGEERWYIDDVELPRLLGGRRDYIFLSNLSRVAVSRDYFGRVLQKQRYTLSPLARSQETSVRVGYGERRYRTTLRLISAGGVGEWRYSLTLDGRTGRDGNIDGYFGNSLGGLLSFGRSFSAVGGGELTISLLGSTGEQSSRGWSSEEVFSLTGNKLYNPYWGVFDGRQRSSRMQRSTTPTLFATYRWSGWDVNWRLSALAMGGERSRSGLQWINAMNPTPDYYTYLPSYQHNPTDIAAAEELWHSGNAKYTQIGWEEFWFQNMLSPDGSAVYLVERAVERPRAFVVGVDGEKVLNTRVSVNLRGELRSESSRYFKQVEDLLGASWTDNRDGFLIDDTAYGNRTENDLRNPNRKVREGDTYGYNYSLHSRSAKVHGGLFYAYRRLSASVSGELSFGSMWRDGHYEKATFAGRSFGESARTGYTAWSFTGEADYSLSPQSTLRLSLNYAGEPIGAEGLFYDARYSNDLISDGALGRRFGLAADYSWRSSAVRFDLAAYYNTLTESQSVTHYYDDLSSLYLDMVMRDIRSRRMGVEAALSLTISSRLDFTVAGAVGNYSYMNNPLAELRRNVDGEPLLAEERILLKGYKPTSSPQYSIATSLSYSLPWSLRANLEWYWAGGRYMELSPLRRSERAIAAAATPEARRAMIEQRSLGAGSQLNLFLYMPFEIGDVPLSATLSINNLLNNSNTLYGGYEPSRLHKQGTALATTVTPHAEKVLYVSPRTLSATLTYKF